MISQLRQYLDVLEAWEQVSNELDDRIELNGFRLRLNRKTKLMQISFDHQVEEEDPTPTPQARPEPQPEVHRSGFHPSTEVKTKSESKLKPETELKTEVRSEPVDRDPNFPSDELVQELKARYQAMQIRANQAGSIPMRHALVNEALRSILVYLTDKGIGDLINVDHRTVRTARLKLVNLKQIPRISNLLTPNLRIKPNYRYEDDSVARAQEKKGKEQYRLGPEQITELKRLRDEITSNPKPIHQPSDHDKFLKVRAALCTMLSRFADDALANMLYVSPYLVSKIRAELVADGTIVSWPYLLDFDLQRMRRNPRTK